MKASQDISSSGAAGQAAVAAGEVRLSPGHRVGRYAVQRLIGVGGMGCVYQAVDTELSRVVALKVLRRDAASVDHESARLRLLREGQAMARLSHPNVVPVYGVDSVDGMVFIAMEYVEGTTLRQWLRQADRSWEEVLDVMLQAGAGLAAAHAQSIIHRDFKPGNVLVGVDGRARVMDFGLARGQDSPSGMVTPIGMHAGSVEFLASQPITKAGAVVGTPAYMAPEQHFGRLADATSDQFAFCVTLYEALFGRRPFSEKKGFRGLARAKDRGEFKRPPRKTTVPRWLTARVLRGLSPRKVDRWPSMPAMLASLRRRQRRPKIPVGLAVGGTVTVMVAGAAAWVLHEDPCAAGLEAFDAVWTDDGRAAVHRALGEAKTPLAEPTFERVAARLDAWAEQWRDAYGGACEAETGEEARDVLACLGRQRAAFGAAVSTLTAPSDALVNSAVRVASSLPRVERCASTPVAGEIAPPPGDARDAVESVRAELAKARVFEVAGRFAEGVSLAEAAVTRAEALAYPPLLGEALRIHGNLLERDGKREAAAKVLERAYVTAVSAGDDRTAAQAALRLVTVHADSLLAPAVAQRWLDELRARVQRLQGVPTAQVWLAQAQGVVGMANSNYADAADAFARGLAHFDATPDADPVRRGSVLHNLGIAYFKAGRSEEARATLTRAIETQEETLGALHPSVATSLMALAGAHFADDQHDAAMDAAQRALALQRQTLGPEHPDVAMGLSNMAGLLIAMGRRDEATAALHEARDIWEAAEGDSQMSAYGIGTLGSLLLSVGEVAQAEPVARRALRLKVDLFGETHEEIGAARTLLGDVLLAAGNADGARQEFEQAVRIYETTLGPHHPWMAHALMRLGKSLADGDPAAARQAFAKAATVAEHNRRWIEAGDAHFAVAKLLALKKTTAAIKRAEAALSAYGHVPAESAAQRQQVRDWLAGLG